MMDLPSVISSGQVSCTTRVARERAQLILGMCAQFVLHLHPVSSPGSVIRAPSALTDRQTVLRYLYIVIENVSEPTFAVWKINCIFKMVYTRPGSIPYPSTWHRFQVVKDGVSQELVIQDLTEDHMMEPAMELLTTHFMNDEPPCKYMEINKHPSAVRELRTLWNSTLKDHLSLACVTSAGQLVAVNVLTVARREDKDEPFQTDDKIWAQLFGAVDFVSKSVDIFSMFEVEEYLTALGLVVDPAWRGLAIGKTMLEARIPLCKALSIKVTATVFTAGASQAVAKKAGFKDLYEISYQELAAKGYVFPGIEADTKSSKLMALVVE